MFSKDKSDKKSRSGKRVSYVFYDISILFQDDFLALEIVDRRVRFLWNVGGGTGVLTHPEVLESGNLQNDTSWYHVVAER